MPPLVLSPSRADAFDLPKRLVSEGLALLSLLLLAWSLRRVDRFEWRAMVARPVVRAVGPLLLVASLGALVTAHREHVAQALPSLWIGAAALVGWSLGLGTARLRRLLDLSVLPAALIGALAILQFHGFQPLAFVGGEQGARLGLTSLAGNAGVLANYLVIPALIAQEWGWRRRQKLLHLVLAGALALVCLYAIAVTQTVAALAAVVVGSALLWLGLLPRRRALAGLAAAALLLATAVAVGTPLRQRVAKKAAELTSGEWNKALAGRLDGWRAAAWMVGEKPFTGVGHGAYSAQFIAAKGELAESGVPFFAGQERVMFVNAHNELLEVAAELGWPGLGALLWGIWVLVRRLRTMPSDGRALAVASVIALAVLASAHFPFRVALSAYPALILLAWIFSEERS